MTDDDWAPLPAERLCERPGDVVDLAPRTPKPSPPPPAPPPPPDPAAERALAALQQRLARQQPGNSFIAQSRHDEQRAARRMKAAGDARLASTLAHGDGAPVLPTVEYAAGADGRDAREESDWFRSLPADEQARLHEAWAQKRTRADDSAAGQRRTRRQRFVAAQIVFVAAIFLGTGAFWHATVAAGIVCGIWWRHASPDRFLDPLRALACMYGLHAVAMLAQQRFVTGMFWDSIFVVALAALVGFDGECRRTGGFDAR
jgi:hypothetical protein